MLLDGQYAFWVSACWVTCALSCDTFCCIFWVLLSLSYSFNWPKSRDLKIYCHLGIGVWGWSTFLKWPKVTCLWQHLSAFLRTNYLSSSIRYSWQEDVWQMVVCPNQSLVQVLYSLNGKITLRDILTHRVGRIVTILKIIISWFKMMNSTLLEVDSLLGPYKIPLLLLLIFLYNNDLNPEGYMGNYL